ncbi:MAG: hypothetical protein IKP97_03935 [Kiritimatiellae bacterium]|nr:hypothetical protein [Kiritimatiellia bacterium]
MKRIVWLAAGLMAFAGCVSPDVTTTTRIDVDDDKLEGGITSADIRTIASRMCPEILSVPEVAQGVPPVRIKIADVKNSSQFFIDKEIFTKKLRMELNKFGRGQVRFLDKNENNQAARAQVLKDREEETVRAELKALAQSIAASPLVQQAQEPVKMAVIPVLNTNLVNMNADSFSAMLRSEIVEAAGGKVQFLMPGHTEGADYLLTGQFYPESLKQEGVINMADYIEVVEERLRDGKSLYIGETQTVVMPSTVSTTKGATKESAILKMLNDPEMRVSNTNKRLNVMIVKPESKLSVYEKTVMLEKRISDNSGKAALILSCEISSLTQQVNGKSSDYVLVGLTLVDPDSNDVIWEDSYEVKRVSQAGVVYR